MKTIEWNISLAEIYKKWSIESWRPGEQPSITASQSIWKEEDHTHAPFQKWGEHISGGIQQLPLKFHYYCCDAPQWQQWPLCPHQRAESRSTESMAWISFGVIFKSPEMYYPHFFMVIHSFRKTKKDILVSFFPKWIPLKCWNQNLDLEKNFQHRNYNSGC